MSNANTTTLREMAQALVALGYTQTRISEEAGVQQPTISRVLAGKGVSYESGKKLETYHQKIFSRRRTKPSKSSKSLS